MRGRILYGQLVSKKHILLNYDDSATMLVQRVVRKNTKFLSLMVTFRHPQLVQRADRQVCKPYSERYTLSCVCSVGAMWWLPRETKFCPSSQADVL